jgi:hypothetical protein
MPKKSKEDAIDENPGLLNDKKALEDRKIKREKSSADRN